MSNDTIPTKTCTKCSQEFPATLEYFYKRSEAKDGLRTDCKQCVNARNKRWDEANPERARINKNKRRRRYVQNHPDKIAEERRKNAKEYYWRNREHRLANMKLWQKNNPDKRRVAEIRRRARKHQLPDTLTFEQWIACLEYFNYSCAVCGCQLRDLFGNVEPHADHWIPLSNSDCPGTVAENIVCLCSFCNGSKFNNNAKEWLIAKHGIRKANEILRRIATYFNSIS